jgi:hypothetical protein
MPAQRQPVPVRDADRTHVAVVPAVVLPTNFGEPVVLDDSDADSAYQITLPLVRIARLASR